MKLMTKIESRLLRVAMPVNKEGKISTLDSDSLMRIEKWILDKRWAEDKSIDEIAKDLGIKKQQLSLHFRLTTGKAFLQWRKEMRIEEAKKMLLDDRTIPTSFIGEAVGIEDKSNFRRQFKEITGCTPSEWRLKH